MAMNMNIYCKHNALQFGHRTVWDAFTKLTLDRHLANRISNFNYWICLNLAVKLGTNFDDWVGKPFFIISFQSLYVIKSQSYLVINKSWPWLFFLEVITNLHTDILKNDFTPSNVVRSRVRDALSVQDTFRSIVPNRVDPFVPTQLPGITKTVQHSA